MKATKSHEPRHPFHAAHRHRRGEQMISRREIICALATLGSATLASASFIRAQPEAIRRGSAPVRRLGALMAPAEGDPEGHRRAAAFEQGLRDLGWVAGSNLRIDYRWAAGETDQFRRFARELVDVHPEIILANSRPALEALRRNTSTIPIVFALVSDPLVGGFVESLARPGGNITGFAGFDFLMPGKMLESLREIAPGVTRVALIGNPETSLYEGFWTRFEALARPLAVQPIAAPVRTESDVKTAMELLGREPGGGLIVLADAFTLGHRDLIVRLADRYRLPAAYPYRYFVESGGLISDGIDAGDVFRRSASYVDRILKGAKPADLPVQQPTKFELVINLRTAKALGLALAPALRSRADEVIE
jgi:putative tryptophan/tyrosine transport system substrate-binding protein